MELNAWKSLSSMKRDKTFKRILIFQYETVTKEVNFLNYETIMKVM